MSEKEKNIGSYDAATIEKYLSGTLTPEQMHAIEKAALDDPFLADAIEGMNQALKDKQSISGNVSELQQRLKQRIADSKARRTPVIAFKNWMQIAAAVTILIFCGLATYYLVSEPKNKIAAESNIAEDKKDTPQTKTNAPLTILTDSTASQPAADKESTETAKITPRKKNARKPEFRKDTAYKEAAGSAANLKADETPKAQIAPAAPEKEDKNLARSPGSEYFVAPSAQNSFKGKVTDEDNKPIPSAHVELADKKIAAVTDSYGNFKLNIKDNDSVVIAKVNSTGYVSAFSDLSNNGNQNVIVLRRQKSGLQEVVTTGMNTRKAKAPVQQTAQDAAPVRGWDEYNKYLENNKKLLHDSAALKGPVVVSFSVNKKGKLSNFAIEQSLGPDYDEEAIRLIKEGPAWKLLKGKQASINVIVSF